MSHMIVGIITRKNKFKSPEEAQQKVFLTHGLQILNSIKKISQIL